MVTLIILLNLAGTVLMMNTFTGEGISMQIKAPEKTEGGSSAEIEIEFSKGNVDGFARFHQELPNGIKATPVYPLDASFTFQDNTISVIWLQLPPEETFSLRYELHFDDRLKGDLKLDGTISFIHENQRKSVHAEETTLTLTPAPGVDESQLVDLEEADRLLPDSKPEPERVTADKPQPPDTPDKPQPTDTPDKAQPTAPPQISPEDERLLNPLEKEEGVYYRVQISAGRQTINFREYFKRRNIDREVKTEIDEGWIKYTIGSYYIYRDARDSRNSLWSRTPINDAFVTAYNNGNRITVQEALMITNQKWYK